jgi:uncharacterized phage protein gp47/JayE
MSLSIPTTQELADRNLSFLESRLGQTTPLYELSFLRVLSKLLAMNDKALYLFAVERALQNFVLKANKTTLLEIGYEHGVTYSPAEKAAVYVSVDTTVGVTIPAGVYFTGDLNGKKFYNDYAVTATGAYAVLLLVSGEAGAEANIDVAGTLTIGTPITGVGSTATVTSVSNVGTDEEETESYRQRVLFKIRSVLGGGNAADYKVWGEGVAGVEKVFPYAGAPSGTSYPADRTLYVEASTSVDEDGIAPEALLDEVRDAVNADPDTGVARPPLGITDDTLYVESITRTEFYVTITDLDVSDESEVDAKSDISSFLILYFLSLNPFVESIDSIRDRNDTITDLTVSKVVQDVLSTYGGTASVVEFGVEGGSSEETYTLSAGEKAKLGTLSYDT